MFRAYILSIFEELQLGYGTSKLQTAYISSFEIPRSHMFLCFQRDCCLYKLSFSLFLSSDG